MMLEDTDVAWLPTSTSTVSTAPTAHPTPPQTRSTAPHLMGEGCVPHHSTIHTDTHTYSSIAHPPDYPPDDNCAASLMP